MTKKTLLIFHPALAPYRVDFFNALHENFNSLFYFNHKNVLDQKFDQTSLRNLLLFEPKYLNFGFNIKSRAVRFGVIRIIFKNIPDIVICSEFSQITIVTFLVKKLLRMSFKLYTISDDSIDNSKNRNGLRSFFRNVISKNIDGVIYPSKDVGIWIKNNISERINALELPIIHDDEVFREKLRNCAEVAALNEKKYNLNDKKIVLYVGRLVEVKNIPLLINALSLLNENKRLLVIVGDGSDANNLIELVKSKNIFDKIIFTGRLEGQELYSWFSIAHIFVLPSIYEPFGAVVNEALLGGCYVLCSNLAGASSLINSENGDLFNPYDEDELKSKLQIALVNVVPIQSSELRLRENKMPFSFSEKVKQLVKSL